MEGHRYLGQLAGAPLMIHPSLPLEPAAFALAIQIGSSFYDGLFLSLAIQLGGRLVTADYKLYKKARTSPFAPWILWIADPI